MSSGSVEVTFENGAEVQVGEVCGGGGILSVEVVEVVEDCENSFTRCSW